MLFSPNILDTTHINSVLPCTHHSTIYYDNHLTILSTRLLACNTAVLDFELNHWYYVLKGNLFS